jgi:uncharacterized protein
VPPEKISILMKKQGVNIEREKEKYRPVRSCIACGIKNEKNKLHRLVALENGMVVMDASQTLKGRGSYVCKNSRCLELAGKNERLSRAFRRKVHAGKAIGG